MNGEETERPPDAYLFAVVRATICILCLFISAAQLHGQVVADTAARPRDTASRIEEVTVTAIAIPQQRRALGYSTQRVEGEALVRSREGSLLNALAGKVAGLQIVSAAGTPGAATSIKLRGVHSIDRNNQSPTGSSGPLFVVDGVPIDNSQFIYRGDPISDLKDVAFSSRAIDLNPADIESIDVLKGPAATALYGTRATGGAVIITTKRGKTGKLSVTYNASFAVDEVNRLPALQTRWAQGDAGRYIPGAPHSWGPLLDSLRYNSEGGIVRANDTAATVAAVQPFDNVGAFFKRGYTTQHTLGISGGTARSSFYASLGHLEQSGVVPSSLFRRSTVRMSGTTGSEKFKLAGSAQYAHSGAARFQQGSNESAVMVGLLRTPPSYDNTNGEAAPTKGEKPYRNPDGSHRRFTAAYDNPFFTVAENPFTDAVDRLTGYVSPVADPWPWMNVTYRIGTDFYSERRAQTFGIGNRRYPSGRLYDDQHTYREVNSDLLVTLRKSAKDFNGSLLMGRNDNRRHYQNLYTQGDSLTIPDYNNIANASSLTSAQYREDVRIGGWFSSLRLDWKRTAYLELTGRYDRASTFGPARDRFFYPAANASVVFSEWFGERLKEQVSLAKLRLSYARAGKEPSAYLTQTNYSSPSFGGGYIGALEFPFLGVNGFTLSNTIGNAALQPEVTRAVEGGLEVQALKGRLGADLAVYDNKSTNQIVAYSVSSASGFSAIVGNVGALRNRGVEVVLRGRPVQRRKFTWDAVLNWSANRNTVLALAEGLEGISISSNFQTIKTRNIAGAPYGALFGSRWLRDAQGRMVIDDDPASAFYGFPKKHPTDSIIGNPNPDWIAGFQNNFTFRSWSLSFLVDVRKGGDI